MLTRLSIRDVVLIKSLDLDLSVGLTTMTGETGAGKSILLDALGLAIGERAESRLVRTGADMADVTAVFDVPTDHPSQAVLLENQLPIENDHIVMRRTLTPDGKSKAYINSTPVAVGLLRQVGQRIIEIQGQFDQHGLMNPASHINILDKYAQADTMKFQVSQAYENWKEAKQTLEDAKQASAEVKEQEHELRLHLEELNALAPKKGEAEELEQRRDLVANTERTIQSIQDSHTLISHSDTGVERMLSQALKALGHSKECSGGVLDDAYQALERALIETTEARHALDVAGTTVENHGTNLSDVDDRLHALRDASRKHGVEPDGLPGLMNNINISLSMLRDTEHSIAQLEQAVEIALETYLELSDTLSVIRRDASNLLCDAVNAELPELRLDGAEFSVNMHPLPPGTWTPHGRDEVTFMVKMNAGTTPAPIHKSASGGELSRILLALKVSLAEISTEETIVFDEIDHGVGGATADAIGERLSRLGFQFQVMTITHSPQVAAKGETHMKITKSTNGDSTETHVAVLDESQRREELARMLSGSEVTEEARAAATRLIG